MEKYLIGLSVILAVMVLWKFSKWMVRLVVIVILLALLAALWYFHLQQG